MSHPIIVKTLSVSVAEIYAQNTCQYPTNSVYSPESSKLNPLSFPSTNFSQSFSNSVIFHKALINLPVEECFKEGIACQQVSNRFLLLGTWSRPGYVSVNRTIMHQKMLISFASLLIIIHFGGGQASLKVHIYFIIYNLCNFV